MSADAKRFNFRIERTTTPKPRPAASELVFGRVFTDHMLLVDHEESRGWHDGRVVPFAPISLSPAAAVLHYAQEVFDGLKAFRGADGRIRVFRIDRHAKRLAMGAERLCLPAIDPELVRAAMLELVRVERDWIPTGVGTALYLRPTIIATEPFLGVRPAKESLFFVIACPVGAYYAQGFGPVKILIEDKYVRAAPGGLGAIKAGANYAASLRAAEEAKAAGWSQVLWTDSHGHDTIEEVGTMNVFVRFADHIATPMLDGTILSGVTRDSVIQLLRRWGEDVRERTISVSEIRDGLKSGKVLEIFGTGTAAVISPVGELGWKQERLVVGDGTAGPLARKLFEAVTGIQGGTQPDPDGWVTVVE